MNPSHPDAPEVARLESEYATILEIVNQRKGEEPPTSDGLRITRQIYLDALTDAAKALKSMIDFTVSKSKR